MSEQLTLSWAVSDEQYLGDGVYIEEQGDGWKIFTWTGEEETNKVYFEQETMDALLKYLGVSMDAKPEQKERT